MAFDTASIGETPSPSLVLNTESLIGYLRNEVPSVFASVNALEVQQLTHGQSNPTYVLKSGDGSSWVLRKKPTGTLLPSAHQIEREVTVLKALAQTDIPVPKIVHFCADVSVLGTAFYIMEHVKGRVFTDSNLPTLLPDERRQVYHSIAHTLGKLHNVDAFGIGLRTFGKTEGYCRRQVSRWWRQYVGSAPVLDRQMEALKMWLESNIPLTDGNPTKPTISHGDFSLANLIFSKDSTRWSVRAIVDWELSTLGDGWADMAYACLPFYGPPTGHFPNISMSVPSGIPSEEEFVKMYATGSDRGLPTEKDWAFYRGLALFRLASICQGVGARAVQGNAASDKARQLGSPKNVALIAKKGLEIVHRSERMPAARVHLLTEFDSAGFAVSDSGRSIVKQTRDFMDRYIFPLEPAVEAHVQSEKRWEAMPRLEMLKAQARKEGLWNLFISPEMAKEIHEIEGLSDGEKQELSGRGLTNLEYSFVAEQMGRCLWAAEVFNCNAPDTGNMEIVSRYGTERQKRMWLVPLLKGQIRSCFAMTEKMVASSDATNIQSRILKQGSSYVLSGRKWFTTGAMHPSVGLCIFMGKTDIHQSPYKQQSMVLVPMDNPGIEIKKEMLYFGYDDAPFGHPEIDFDGVQVSVDNLLGKEGQGFEIAQSRLGPGRLHHCMRLIGVGQRALNLAKERVRHRVAFGKALAHNSAVQMDIGHCAVKLRAARLLVLSAASGLDLHGGKYARAQIAAAKVFVPETVAMIVDRAMQMHGGGGLSDDFPLARMYAAARSLRIADGPDEVHVTSIGKMEMLTSKL